MSETYVSYMRQYSYKFNSYNFCVHYFYPTDGDDIK